MNHPSRPSSPTPLSALLPLAESLEELLPQLQPLPGTSYHDATSGKVEEIESLLREKLLPSLRDGLEGPVLAVVAGGTNVGKSSVFGWITGSPCSPVEEIGGATRTPVLFSHEHDRHRAQTKLEPFELEPCTDPASALSDKGETADLLFDPSPSSPVTGLLLVDSPDVDSVVESNARTARRLLFAADVLLFVTTPEKYGDEVPSRFLQAGESMGKSILVTLNKVADEEELESLTHDLSSKMNWNQNGPAIFSIPRLGRGMTVPPEESTRPIREALTQLVEEQPSPYVRAARGAAVRMNELAKEVRETLLEEQRAIDELRETVRSLIDHERDLFQSVVLPLPFLEQDRVVSHIVRHFEVPLLDRVARLPSEAVRGLVRLLGLPVSVPGISDQDRIDQKIESRNEGARREVIESLDRATLSVHRYLRDSRERAVFQPLYARAAELHSPADREKIEERFNAFAAESVDLASRMERDVLQWIEGHPRAGSLLRFLKSLVVIGSGVFSAYLTGGLGPGDFLTGPLSGLAAKWGIEYFAPPRFLKSYEAEFRRKLMQVYEDSADGLIRKRVDGWLPGAPAGPTVVSFIKELERLLSIWKVS